MTSCVIRPAPAPAFGNRHGADRQRSWHNPDVWKALRTLAIILLVNAAAIIVLLVIAFLLSPPPLD
jgi:hypothetical protein